jgi:hypothetical protein
MVSECYISVPKSKLATGYDSWQVSSTFHPHTLSPQNPFIYYLHLSFLNFQTDVSPPKFCMNSSPPSPGISQYYNSMMNNDDDDDDDFIIYVPSQQLQ